MVADRLSDDYVVVQFSPWRYEAYEDVKAALMEAVLTKLDACVQKAADPQSAAGLMKRGNAAGDDGRAAGHGLDDRQTKPFAVRWQHDQ